MPTGFTVVQTANDLFEIRTKNDTFQALYSTRKDPIIFGIVKLAAPLLYLR